MSYLSEITSYATYDGQDADFHFNYNANSGGGQAFLGGRLFDRSHNLVFPETLNGKTVIFVIKDGFGHEVKLDDPKTQYQIKPRGEGSTSMKLGVGDNIAPSRVISSLFLLPPTCGVKHSTNLDISILATDNFWLHSMWLECSFNTGDSNIVYFIPKDCVFGAGESRDRPDTTSRYFNFDIIKRIRDIIAISDKASILCDEAKELLLYFSDVFKGSTPYSYDKCYENRNRLMQLIAQMYPDRYSGVIDVLPVIYDIIEEKELEKKAGSQDMALKYNTQICSDIERNRIVFGAPGTGKSYKLKIDSALLVANYGGEYERVTFHPDYTYSQFVGSYKPTTDQENVIKYEFVPGPFMRVFVNALKSGKSQTPQPYILIIEEINRSKVAAVFGDIFQLLDRDESGISEYDIQASEDVRKYLAKELGGIPGDYQRIKLPDNMFIWATMNSADQGVFPMDTAFKRRWNFEYIGINENDRGIRGHVILGTEHPLSVEWNALRKAINEKMAKEFKLNEDKLIGPYFLSKKIIKTVSPDDDSLIDTSGFIEAFKSKVIMYLYEDAAKQYKHKLFSGCPDTTKYSAVCECFEKIGIRIFGEDFEETYYNSQKG